MGTMLIVTDLAEDEAGDSFKILFEKPVSLTQVTSIMANEFELFRGEKVDYRSEKFEDGRIKRVDRPSGDLLVRPIGSKDLSMLTDSYRVKELNCSLGMMPRFYQFLEARFG